MLISRGASLIRNVAVLTTRTKAPMKSQVRHSGGPLMYRDVWEPRRFDVYMAEFLGGIMWWWIFWNMWHEWDHIVGHYAYPDPLQWTDQELGIPPDHADD